MAGGGGAWKVAYADFVTAMMAFFMVMWLTTQKQGVKEAVAGYFREPFATFKSHQKGAASTAKPVVDPMYGHTAQPQKRRLAISGDATDYQFTVLFPDGSADLEPAEMESIRGFTPMMVGKLNRIEVRAHCIRSPLSPDSPFADHWAMCFARCQRVQHELESLGIEPSRIRLSQAEGNEPLAVNLSPQELKLNSRVDVILLPDLVDVPWEQRRAEGSEVVEPTDQLTPAEHQAEQEANDPHHASTIPHTEHDASPHAAPPSHASAESHDAHAGDEPHSAHETETHDKSTADESAADESASSHGVESPAAPH